MLTALKVLGIIALVEVIVIGAGVVLMFGAQALLLASMLGLL